MSEASVLSKFSSFFSRSKEKQYQDGPLTEEVIRDWLIKRLAKQIKSEESLVDPRKSFEDYGLDSIVAVKISGDLERLVERRLSPALLFEHSNIDDLSRFLAESINSSSKD